MSLSEALVVDRIGKEDRSKPTAIKRRLLKRLEDAFWRR